MKGRYFVLRSMLAWEVIDGKTKKVVASLSSRNAARLRARELNQQRAETKEEIRHGI
jgi:hypothetical protein